MNKFNILLRSCCTIFCASSLGTNAFVAIPQIARHSVGRVSLLEGTVEGEGFPHRAIAEGVEVPPVEGACDQVASSDSLRLCGTVAPLKDTPSDKGEIALVTDPLVLDRQDPFIPKGYGKRKLTSFEKYRIEQEIARLDKKAQAEFDHGNVNLAVKLWYRQLRLTRVIDTKAEIVTLGEIGAIVWEKNRSEDVRNIANRLIAIQTEPREKKLAPELLDELAIAYQEVRYLDKAIEIYQLILVEKKKFSNSVAKQKLLNKLGELYLGIFDYSNAANIYQKLLDDSSFKVNREVQLKRLVEIYHNARLSNKAIATRKLLIAQYIGENKNNRIPILELANARDRVTLKQFDLAIQTYNTALEKASAAQQLAVARDALIGIGQIYQKQQKLELAIETYKKLLAVQKQADNVYGAIDTYDILGNIYLQSNRPNQATKAFKKGLEISKEFDYKVKYFKHKIEKINEKFNS